uniref:Uncharacterized protein LOC111133833 isoform X2 n=1 Tax=Crassostrea virginica TaxID=6565 RepID=A0A8B8EC61_CRAVI|nr:uncharacterized protein LOC111133833 isoform X2 [Crassostrea virginica]
MFICKSLQGIYFTWWLIVILIMYNFTGQRQTQADKIVRSPMEKNIIKDCTYANACRECSTFTIDEHIDNPASMRIWWTETCNKTNEYSPETTVEIEITSKTLSFNQTRCCEGQRTLFFTGISLDRPLPTVTSVNNLTATSRTNSTYFQDPGISKGLSIQLLLTVAIVATAVLVLITTVTVIVIVCKRME